MLQLLNEKRIERGLPAGKPLGEVGELNEKRIESKCGVGELVPVLFNPAQ